MIEFLIYSSGIVLLGVAFLLATTELFDPVIVAVARLLGHEVEVRPLYDAWSESRFTTIDQEPVKSSIAATPTRRPRKQIEVIKTSEPRICRRCSDQLDPGEEHSHG